MILQEEDGSPMAGGAAPEPAESAGSGSRGLGAARRSDRSRPARTGRRPGNPDTRQAILDAARITFAELGFAVASMRKIAAAAGVDAALVHHYFGSKEKLFLATVEVPIELPKVIARLSAEGIDGLGVRLISTILGVWESPAGASIGAVVRSALADPSRAKMLREFVVPRLIAPLLRPLHIPQDELELRTGLVMTQVMGVVAGRYLLAIEPLASLPVDQLAANVGATLQRYLTGPLTELTGPTAEPTELDNSDRGNKVGPRPMDAPR